MAMPVAVRLGNCTLPSEEVKERHSTRLIGRMKLARHTQCPERLDRPPALSCVPRRTDDPPQCKIHQCGVAKATLSPVRCPCPGSNPIQVSTFLRDGREQIETHRGLDRGGFHIPEGRVDKEV